MNGIVGRLRERVRLAPDDGFSLIEVVVAIVIVGTLTVTSLAIFLSSMEAANSHQRRQIAVTVANESMESVAAWSTGVVASTGVSALYTGRSQTNAVTLWANNPTVDGVGQTYARWDPTANAGSVPSLPFTRTTSRSGTTFTVTTFIGSCYQNKTGGNCTKVSGSPTAPPTTIPSTVTPLIRIIVNVRWTAGNSCETADCSYTVSTLVDINSDQEWKSNVP